MNVLWTEAGIPSKKSIRRISGADTRVRPDKTGAHIGALLRVSPHPAFHPSSLEAVTVKAPYWFSTRPSTR